MIELSRILNQIKKASPENKILQLIPRHVFQKLEIRHVCDRSSRKFGFKEQFTVLAFLMLAASRTMRDVLASLNAQGYRLYHWGLKNFAVQHFQMQTGLVPGNFLKVYFVKCARFA